MRRARAAWAIALAAALALPGPAGGQAAATKVEISSDRLVVDPGRRTARFEGNVAARYGDLSLACGEMTATYGADGAVTALDARGRVIVRRGDAVAEAASARLEAGPKLLVLEGSPSVARGPHRLRGSRIAVHLDTGEIEVLEARGTFELPLGGGR